jgi:hypothetical protein
MQRAYFRLPLQPLRSAHREQGTSAWALTPYAGLLCRSEGRLLLSLPDYWRRAKDREWAIRKMDELLLAFRLIPVRDTRIVGQASLAESMRLARTV